MTRWSLAALGVLVMGVALASAQTLTLDDPAIAAAQ
jgi:hypothetical protein